MVIFQRKSILTRESGAFDVVIEGVRICSIDNVLDSFLVLLLAIYCFNLAYPKELTKTFLYVQKMLLKIEDEQSNDKKLLSLLAQLNSM